MLINRRNALMTGKKWKNPYVTDGLVAMWDGEWNAGGGVHDPNATVWKDLSGNEYNANINVSSLSIGNNYIEWDPKGSATSVYQNVSQNLSLGCTSSVVVDIQNQNTTTDFMTIGSHAAAFAIASAKRIVGCATSSTRRNYRYIGSLAGKQSIDVVFKPYSAKVFVNGVQITPGDVFWGSTSVNFKRIQLFNTASGNGRMRTYSFKTYAKPLTDAEIAANYAIDKERFNLP